MCTYPVLDTVTDAGGIAFSRKKIPLSSLLSIWGARKTNAYISNKNISNENI